MTNYWQVTTQFERESDTGRVQKVKEVYLVDAMSVTEAEARMTEYLSKDGKHDFEIVAAGVSRIVGVVEKSV